MNKKVGHIYRKKRYNGLILKTIENIVCFKIKQRGYNFYSILFSIWFNQIQLRSGPNQLPILI